MTPRPALAATIAASLLVLCATGALAAGSPQLAGYAPDKTSPPTLAVGAPTTTVPPAPTTAAAPATTSTTPVDAGPPIGDVVDAGDAKPAAVLRRLPRRRARRPSSMVGHGVPTALRGTVRTAGRRDLRRLPGTHRADPRLRLPGQHELPGGQRLRRVLLPRRRLHGVRRRRARGHLRTRRAVQPVGRRHRPGPRVRPRRPVPHRRPRSRRGDDLHRAAGRLLLRGLGRPRLGGPGCRVDVRRRRRPHRPDRPRRRRRPDRHRASSSRADMAPPSTASARSRSGSTAASTVASGLLDKPLPLLPNEFDPRTDDAQTNGNARVRVGRRARS